MDRLVQKLIPYLISSQIDYCIERSKIEVSLPENFGRLEIKDFENQEVVIGIVDGNWQIVSDQLEIGENDPEEKVISYIEGIYNGTFLMVEEHQPGEPTKKKIVNDLERYLQDLPNRTKFKIHKNQQETEEDPLFSDV